MPQYRYHFPEVGGLPGSSIFHLFLEKWRGESAALWFQRFQGAINESRAATTEVQPLMLYQVLRRLLPELLFPFAFVVAAAEAAVFAEYRLFRVGWTIANRQCDHLREHYLFGKHFWFDIFFFHCFVFIDFVQLLKVLPTSFPLPAGGGG